MIPMRADVAHSDGGELIKLLLDAESVRDYGGSRDVGLDIRGRDESGCAADRTCNRHIGIRESRVIRRSLIEAIVEVIEK